MRRWLCAAGRVSTSVFPFPASSPFEGEAPAAIGGPCGLCGVDHAAPLDPVCATAALQAWWLELSSSSSLLAPKLRQAGGKMIAVLVGLDGHGQRVELRGISGDLLGVGDVDGCVPSIIRREDTADLEAHTLAIVQQATATLDAGVIDGVDGIDDDDVQRLRQLRKQASRTLMAAMNDAVTLVNRAGREASLRDVFVGDGIPSGTADCALPKLLQQANRQGLTVLGVAEAWWGPGLGVGERRHGLLAMPCARRCAPILGYLVCDAP